MLSDSEEDEEQEESPLKPFKNARPGPVFHDDDPESESSEDADAAENDAFIVEDDNDTPMELPTEFSMSTYQDLTHHFKVICQLFVHLAVQEKENRLDFMEQMSKGKLRRKSGMVSLANLCLQIDTSLSLFR